MYSPHVCTPAGTENLGLRHTPSQNMHSLSYLMCTDTLEKVCRYVTHQTGVQHCQGMQILRDYISADNAGSSTDKASSSECEVLEGLVLKIGAEKLLFMQISGIASDRVHLLSTYLHVQILPAL